MQANGTSSQYDTYRTVIRQRNLSIFLLLAAIVVVLLFFRNSFSEPIYLEAADTSFNATGPDGESVSVPYADITGVTLTDAWDVGNLVAGSDTGSARAGIWQHDAAGDYALFALNKTEHLLVLTLGGDGVSVSGAGDDASPVHTVVFGYESDETMDGVYAAMPDLLEKKGYGGQATFTSDLSE